MLTKTTKTTAAKMNGWMDDGDAERNVPVNKSEPHFAGVLVYFVRTHNGATANGSLQTQSL